MISVRIAVWWLFVANWPRAVVLTLPVLQWQLQQPPQPYVTCLKSSLKFHLSPVARHSFQHSGHFQVTLWAVFLATLPALCCELIALYHVALLRMIIKVVLVPFMDIAAKHSLQVHLIRS
jgi:hypothetical protein